jgi:hypothetical protein
MGTRRPRAGRPVTCEATLTDQAFNLMQLSQQQYRTFGSFGAATFATASPRRPGGMLPVIRTEAELADFERPLARVEGRHGFGAQWTRSTSDNRLELLTIELDPKSRFGSGRSLWPQSVLNDD